MREHPSLKDAKLYTELPNKKYDILLVPETIEHVDNVGIFLLSLIPLVNSTSNIILTAPNAFCKIYIIRNRVETDKFIEIVHPDHNCWYSLYTLPNVIRKIYKRNGINININEIGLLEGDTMVYVNYSICSP